MKDISATISDTELLELLAKLPEEDVDFERAVDVMQIAPGHCVATPEELNKNLYVLLNGALQLTATSKEGRSLTISWLAPGSVFGENAVLNLKSRANAWVQPIETSTVWRIPGAEARNYLERYPLLGLALLRTLGRRLAQVEDRLEEVAYKKLPERLAGELLRRRAHFNNDQVRISHQALADTLGTYRETISAILRDFKRAQLVTLGYRRITIKNLEALQRLAANE